MKLLLYLILLVYILNNNGYTSSNFYYMLNEGCTNIIKYDYYCNDLNACCTVGENIMLTNISGDIDVYSYNKHPLIFFDFKTEESNAYLNNESGHDLTIVRDIPKHKKNFTKYEIRQRKPN